jgi:hypothetical protein
MLGRYRRTLLRLVRELHLLSDNPDDLSRSLRLQEEIILRITSVERRIRKAKRRRKELKSGLKSRREVPLSKTEASMLKEKIDYIDWSIDQYQYLLRLLRSIGDGIAFTYVDRWDIKPLAFRQEAGFLSGKQGSRLERAILRQAFRMGAAAILNDITNCLRVGDVTVTGNGPPLFVEAKSGRRQSSRDARQAKEFEKTMAYLNSDVAEELYGQAGLWRRIAAHTNVIEHSDKITNLLRQLRDSSAVWVEAEPGLRYMAAKDVDPETLAAFARGAEGAIGYSWVPRDPADTPAYYPLCLSIRDPDEWYRFVSGDYGIMVGIDEEVAREHARRIGTNLRFERNDAMFPLRVIFSFAPDGPVEVMVGWHFMGRMFTEFLSLQWFVSELSNRSTAVGEYLAIGEASSEQEE